MNVARRRPTAGPAAALASFSSSAVELPEYIITTFMPSLQPLLARYPLAFRIIGVMLALWYLGPINRLKALWSSVSGLLVSTVTVSSDEDLFDYLVSHLLDTGTIRADPSLNVLSNIPKEDPRRMWRGGMPEESNRRAAANNEMPRLKYEHVQGTELFVFKRRLFWATRKNGEGSTLRGSSYRQTEVLAISTLGRSTGPIKAFLEHIYFVNKDKERSLTVIRRPNTGGMSSRLSWSRITAKPRRALDTVILDADQKDMVLNDMAEYMEETTAAFYGRHGIPYRRGYLFHGPPGVGKTSFALALANKFNLDVYVLTLLDQNLTDSDLVSLLNQLPGRSLLLLEDIDTAGLSNRKQKSSSFGRTRPGRGVRDRFGRGRGVPNAGASSTRANEAETDEDEAGPLTSNISLSALLNAIDGVAAPEGHILIMTTNKPHDLDDALVRAGRISVRVQFDTASFQQAKEIFRRMYIEPPAPTGATTAVSTIDGARSEKPVGVVQGMPEAELEELADNFATRLPEREFSPADLQDYLLMNRKNPKTALDGLDKWIVKTREENAKKEEMREVERQVRREMKRREELEIEAEYQTMSAAQNGAAQSRRLGTRPRASDHAPTHAASGTATAESNTAVVAAATGAGDAVGGEEQTRQSDNRDLSARDTPTTESGDAESNKDGASSSTPSQ
jgi:mitochondrial chaperone BCS1